MKDLRAIITPSLLKQLGHVRVPFPRNDPISGNALMGEFFGDEYHFSSHATLAWPALLALSDVYGPSTVPDMASLLPHPASHEFPLQALGMHTLLDQCPRLLFQGVDGRWTSWFDKVARKLYDFLYSLPKARRPWTQARWEGASFEYWFRVAYQFNVSMTHHEARADQEVSVAVVEDLRRAVEQWTGHRDPRRDDADWRTDVYAFPRLINAIDLDRDYSFLEAAFFFLEVVDVHKPVIDLYGRYPYRNAIEGRVSTEQERVWIEKTDHFAEASPDVARKVREDIEASRWRPLGKDKDNTEAGACVDSVSSEACLHIMIQAPGTTS